MRPYEATRGRKVGLVLLLTLFFLILVGASALAKRHYKQGKGDRQGAFRLARFVFLAYMAIWLCYGHFMPAFGVVELFVLAVSTALFMSGLTWVLYMALEPYVRKLWPQSIISWTRLMSGRVRDPLVGRDVLYGVMLGLTCVLLSEFRLSFWITHLGTAPQLYSWTEYLLGARATLGAYLVQLTNSIQVTLLLVIVLVGLRYLLRNRWAAAAGLVVILTTIGTLGSDHPGIELLFGILIWGIVAFALVRFGLITMTLANFVTNIMIGVPITLDFSRWYATAAMSCSLSVLALGVWGFYTALGGQKLIKGEMLE